MQKSRLVAEEEEAALAKEEAALTAEVALPAEEEAAEQVDPTAAEKAASLSFFYHIYMFHLLFLLHLCLV